MRHVAIIGGGIAGLAAAHAVVSRARALDVPVACTLIEGGPTWGGKIATHHVGGLLIEAGPDSFLSQKPAGVALCEELGLGDELVNTQATQEKAFVYSRGRLRALPEGLVVVVPTRWGPFLRSGLISWPGMVRMALEAVIPAKRDTADESLAAFFRRRLGREACERLVEPLLAGIYGGDAGELSIRATFPRFVDLERTHGSLVRGLLSASPRTSGPPSGRTPFVTLRRGLGSLIDRLVERLEAAGATLRIGQRAEAMRVRSTQLGSWTYDIVLDGGGAVSADAVVLATPAYVSADLVRPLSPVAADLLSGIRYSATATVSAAYARGDVGEAVRGFGFVVPKVEGRTLLAATWTSLKWPARAPADTLLMRAYLGGVGGESVVAENDESLIRRVRDDLRVIVGLTGQPCYAEVNRWPRAMPQYAVGHLDRLEQITTALCRYPGLYLAGAAYRGVGIPDCIADGTRAAELVVQHVGRNLAKDGAATL